MTRDSVAAQQAALATMYRTHVATGTRYALVDFPDHANVGDSAIWLGERMMLQTLTGRGPCYVSTWHDFAAEAFREACPDGVLFLHGGGNLGDIWPHHQHFRERILATVRDRPVVQLPQSIHFRDPAGTGRFAALAADHPDFTLYVRDARSLDLARRHVACPSHLAPDSAYALGPQSRAAPDCDLLLLMRTDDERRDHTRNQAMPPPVSESANIVDWLEDGPDLPAGINAPSRDAQAAARVARGLRLLSRGRVIVTDRLHGHILADLLGIPHVVLDNDYGKIAAYREAWAAPSSAPSSSVATATTMTQALATAARFVDPA